MKANYRVSIGQVLVAMIFSALCGAGVIAGIGNLHLPSAHAAEIQSAASQDNGDGKEAKTKTACPVVHFDIGCKDNAKTKEFYTKLFDWHVNQQGPAGVIDTGSKEGIQGHITSLGHEPEHYVTFYVQVNDINRYLEKTNKLGGKTLVPAISISDGKFAWISDPDGNIVGLLQPKAVAK